jgi:hypothetical protein
MTVTMTQRLTRALLGPGPGETDTSKSHAESSPLASVMVLTAAVSIVAGMIHIRASIDHAQEFLLYTPVFALLAALQIAWGASVVRGCSRRILLAGGVLNLAVIVLWVASRTTGVPIAPVPWVPEPVGASDLMATVAEVVIVIATTCLLTAGRSPLAQRILARLAPVLLAVIFLCVTFGVGTHAQ